MKLHPSLRALLWPFSLVFEGIVRVRAHCYRMGIVRQKRLKSVVISVGNLTVGGTGKTPLVMWIVERLLSERKPTGILTRGYRGSKGSNLPLAATAPVPEDHVPLHVMSDEVWLYWKRFGDRVRIGVGADRFACGRRLEQGGVQWLVLDDGFQHMRLARDIDIVLVDATDPFGGGLLLPAGRLREPASALGRADLVVITRRQPSAAVEVVIRRYTEAPIFYAQNELSAIVQRNPHLAGAQKADTQRRKFFAFCAIGNPNAFFEDLRGWGMHVLDCKSFRDHHKFSQADVQELEARARSTGAEALVCTEKDIFNCLQVEFSSLPLFYCRTSLTVLDGEGLWQAVLRIIARSGEKAGNENPDPSA
ncbi:MAG: tetraacyldisaccharide 4'-kinase [Acidobacteria bacterium]|nr:tetraacyldisaccharide 4'-kinase [Acidobacteriota bacterium]MCL5289329.1 tetraacyldisaccharide 4'-kinase [Acidobacteriota bacterium]